MNQLINNLNASNQLQGNGQLTTQFSNHLNTPGHSTPTPEDAGYGSGAYSPMHASAHASQYSPMHAPRPPPYLANGRLAEVNIIDFLLLINIQILLEKNSNSKFMKQF